MCGRYTLKTPVERLAEKFSLADTTDALFLLMGSTSGTLLFTFRRVAYKNVGLGLRQRDSDKFSTSLYEEDCRSWRMRLGYR